MKTAVLLITAIALALCEAEIQNDQYAQSLSSYTNPIVEQKVPEVTLRTTQQFTKYPIPAETIPVRILQEPAQIRPIPEPTLHAYNANVDTEIYHVTTAPVRRPVPNEISNGRGSKFYKNNDDKNIATDGAQIQERKEKSSSRGSRRYADADAYIVRYSHENNGFKGYKFGYATSNGIIRNEELVFEDPENKEQGTIHGGYEYTDAFGKKVVVTYTAGIHGFRPIIKYID